VVKGSKAVRSSGGKSRGRGRGRGRGRENGTSFTVSKGAGKRRSGGKGRGGQVRDGSARRSNAGKGGGKNSRRRSTSNAVEDVRGRLRTLWRGARSAKGRSKGQSKGRGKGAARQEQQNVKRVNRAGGIVKRGRRNGAVKGRAKGKGKAGKGGQRNALALRNDSYSKGYGKKGYSKGKGGGGKGFGGGGGWGQDFHDDRFEGGYDDYSKGGGKGYNGGFRGPEPKATEQLSAEDRRMMKKITIVAQLDKVPKPHPAMHNISNKAGGRRSSGDGGSLSNRFAANFGR